MVLHIALVAVMSCLLFCGAVASIIAACNVESVRARRLMIALSIITVPATIAGFGWIIVAANQTPEVEYTVDYEVKLVKFPDGKEVQMYHVDGENINANRQFSCHIPDNAIVRRFFYKRVACNIYFPPTQNAVLEQYAIVLKNEPVKVANIDHNVVTEESNGEMVAIDQGGELVVRLRFRPGTGYGWAVVGNDEKILKSGEVTTEKVLDRPKDGKVKPAIEPMAGGEEVQVFRFKGVSPGEIDLKFHHRRPFEKQKVTKEFNIKVFVNKVE